MKNVTSIFRHHLLLAAACVATVIAIGSTQVASASAPVHAYNALTYAQLRALSGASANAKLTHQNMYVVKQQLDTYTAWAIAHPYTQEANVSFQRGTSGQATWNHLHAAKLPGGPPGSLWTRQTGATGYARYNGVTVEVSSTKTGSARLATALWIIYHELTGK